MLVTTSVTWPSSTALWQILYGCTGWCIRWSFAQLEQFIRYKAEAFGFEVINVDPQNTSRGCSRCGYTDQANRHRLDFWCHACNLQLNAELNASRNIRLRGILVRHALYQDGPPSTGPEARPADSGWTPDEGTGKLTPSGVSR